MIRDRLALWTRRGRFSDPDAPPGPKPAMEAGGRDLPDAVRVALVLGSAAAVLLATHLALGGHDAVTIIVETAAACAAGGLVIYGLVVRPLRRASAALRDSERRYRMHFENVNDVICSLDCDLVITAISPSVRTMLGRAPEELIGRRLDQSGMIEPGSLPAAVAAARRVLGGQRIESAEFRFTAGDGRTLLGECSGAPCIVDGRVIGMVVVTRDITERRRVQGEAETARAMLENLANGITDGVALLSADMKIVWANRAFAKATGVEPAELIGRHCYESQHHRRSPCVAPSDPCPIDEVVRTGRPVVVTHTHTHAEGEQQVVEVTAYPVTDAQGRIVQFVHLSRDVTEKMQLEQQLNRAQKMEAIGQLAGGVAHDFNNILTGITGFAQVAAETDPAPVQAECLDEIRKLADRGADLTRQLLTIGRHRPVQPSVLDLNAIVDGAISLLRRLIGGNIQLQWRPAEDLDRVLADPSQIEQVLTNLVINARDAMAGGGTLTIQTGNLPPAVNGQDDRPAELASAHCVVVSVADTGCGMDPATQDHIFEPFFTTKEPGKGTGLGLPSVYSIVRQHGGHVSVASRPGAGSLFRVFLPRADALPTASSRPAANRPGNLAAARLLPLSEQRSMVR